MNTKANGTAAAAAETQDAATSDEADKTLAGNEGDETASLDKAKKEFEDLAGDDKGKKDPQEEDAEASEAASKLAKRKRTMQDRLDQVTGKYRDADRRARTAERKLADLNKRMEKGYDDDPDPTLNYSLDKREATKLKDERDEAVSDKEEARMTAWKERASDFSETHTDFQKVAYSAPIGDETSELISDMEEGPAVAYELGKNHAEARRIDRLPATAKAFALGRIAERITSKPLQRITQAPKPIENGAGSGKSGAKPNFDKLSPSDYAKIVAEEEKAKAR